MLLLLPRSAGDVQYRKEAAVRRIGAETGTYVAGRAQHSRKAMQEARSYLSCDTDWLAGLLP
jgi:hypothetical protein